MEGQKRSVSAVLSLDTIDKILNHWKLYSNWNLCCEETKPDIVFSCS